MLFCSMLFDAAPALQMNGKDTRDLGLSGSFIVDQVRFSEKIGQGILFKRFIFNAA